MKLVCIDFYSYTTHTRTNCKTNYWNLYVKVVATIQLRELAQSFTCTQNPQYNYHTHIRTHLLQMYRKSIRDHRRILDQALHKVEDVHSRNLDLDRQLMELEVSVSERKQVEHLAGEMGSWTCL